jgi:hypothetical protein
MVVDYLQIRLSYSQILQTLETTAVGTPFRRLERLERFGLHVTVGNGSLLQLEAHLNSNLPIIADVDTSELSYWQQRTDISQHAKSTAHALVVVGMQMGVEKSRLFVDDPDFEHAPQIMDIGEFELAWLIRDYRYALMWR